MVICTKDKPAALASDSLQFYANLENDQPMGLYFGNLYGAVKAFETIRRLDGIVIPGHDPKVMIRFTPIDKQVVRIYP